MNIRDDAPASLQGRELQEAASGTEFEKLAKSLLLVAYSYYRRSNFKDWPLTILVLNHYFLAPFGTHTFPFINIRITSNSYRSDFLSVRVTI
jgi:hypothetical protein